MLCVCNVLNVVQMERGRDRDEWVVKGKGRLIRISTMHNCTYQCEILLPWLLYLYMTKGIRTSGALSIGDMKLK